MSLSTIQILGADGTTKQAVGDIIAGNFWPLYKTAFGAENAVTLVDVANPLPVSAVQSGTWNTNAVLRESGGNEIGTQADPMWVGLSDGTLVFKLDSLTGYVVTIGTLHNKIHEGDAYLACRIFNAVAAAATVSIRVTVPAGIRLHMTASMTAILKAEIQIQEGTTFSAPGTTITPRNLDRPTGDVSGVLTRYNPTVNVAGLEIGCGLIPAGSKINSSSGGSVGVRSERILTESTEYLYLVTNTGDQASDVWIGLEWYELAVP